MPGPWQALGARILTTDTLFEQADLPSRIAVIGMGAIGVEVAQALARLGLDVCGFDSGESIAGLSDPEVVAALRDSLGREFPIRLGTEVELAEAGAALEIRAGDTRLEVDKAIVAVGRRPNLEGLGLETLGVPLDEKGLPPVDPETMRIADTPVFLTGDANADRPLLHEAADDGHIAGLNATGDAPIRLPRRTPLSVVFCHPQAAVVGQPHSALDDATTIVGEADFARQGRARIIDANRGTMRLYAAREGGRLLGAEMAAPAGEHMAHLLALAIGQGLTVHDVLRMPFYHPTLEEGLRSALRALARQLPPCSPSDLAGCGVVDIEALD